MHVLVFFSFFFFFVPWAAPKTRNRNMLHFGPCFFWCFFWWPLLVKIGYTQIIMIIFVSFDDLEKMLIEHDT